MGQPTKRYSTQDVWKSYWCGPTIFDRIGKDFDKSGYDLHWLRDALTSAYDVQESCRSSVNEKLRHPYTLSVLEKARLLCDAQDNRQARGGDVFLDFPTGRRPPPYGEVQQGAA
ncbi:hypothetical protein [Bifidobacterium breve]|uniref:hypothetical protein n=1 Tax=Bifidobacterium breve TaxID=1685 RepID=UPI00254C3913|nr:hypothetical protein [Bifidobacterium breve]MDK7091895.1 hypothetical protein [Bifidobacterium breve]